jgi:hypothetical protein
MKSRLFGIAVSAAMVALASVKSAEATTYTYTGGNYSAANIGEDPPLVGTFNDTMKISGSFQTLAPLAANLSAVLINPLVQQFSFSNGAFTITNLSPDLHEEFFMSTDGSGKILGWQILLVSPNHLSLLGDPSWSVATDGYFHSDRGGATVCTTVVNGVCTQDAIAGAFADNGVWTSDAPDTAATPLPAAFPLFAGGLGVIGLLARRRKRMAHA